MNADAELAELRLQFGILAAYCDAAMWALIADLRLYRLIGMSKLGCRCRRLEALAAADHAQRTGEPPRKIAREDMAP